LPPLQSVLADYTRRQLRTRFAPTTARPSPCIGPMDCGTGLMGRATTILLRRTSEARNLLITVRHLEDTPLLYPLDLTASIPTASGGTSVTTTISSNELGRTTFLLPIPPEIPEDGGMDIEIRADRVVVAKDVLALRSVSIESIEQQP
ncbi:MAG: hypothetical protein AAF657_36295, partial [Acidobacteriota bacterium]